MKLFTDGGARGNPGPAACAAVLLNDEDAPIFCVGSYLGVSTNNQAEYHGLLIGLKECLSRNLTSLECFLDSELIVKQLNKEYRVKDAQLVKLYSEVQSLVANFTNISFTHVPRSKNKLADKKVNEILDEVK